MTNRYSNRPETELRMMADAHRSELAWVADGYARLADAIKRDYNDVRVEIKDDGTWVSVREDGQWTELGRLLSPLDLGETLSIMRD